MSERDIKGSNDASCPVLESINLLGGRYKLLIVRALLGAQRRLRFGELAREVGDVSQKTLSRNLKELEKAGLVTRTAFAEVPPRVEYELTEEGKALFPVFVALREWRETFH